MSTRSRKRNAAVVDVQQGVSTKSSRTRRVVKIELENDTDNNKTSPMLSDHVHHQSSEIAKQSSGQLLDKPESEIVNPISKSDKRTSPSAGKSANKTTLKVELAPPSNWRIILENIRIMRSGKTAAVDTMGCERTADLSQEPKVQRFQTLVSLMLSSQTKDQVTYAAMERLKGRDGGLTVQAMLCINETELGETIKPVGFYKRKATYIKNTAKNLREKYDDDIPRTVEDLCSLPGVGPKMAYICMHAAWNENAGIGVDTHVHRIANRLKWTGTKGTSTPEKTREALEAWMPKDLWQDFNILLVGFGQEICLPIGPKCDSCLNKNICPSSTISKPKKKQSREKL